MMLSKLTPTATYRAREYGYDRIGGHELAEGRLTLKVERGNRVIDNTYAVQCERDETGFLHTVYLAKERSEDGEVYGIEFSRRGASRCSCIGFARHGHCKHDDAVRELILGGRLTAEAADVTPSFSFPELS